MFLIRRRMVEAPSLSEEEIIRLRDWESIDSPVPMREGDAFLIEYGGESFPVFCFRSTGCCRIRRMKEREIEYGMILFPDGYHKGRCSDGICD